MQEPNHDERTAERDLDIQSCDADRSIHTLRLQRLDVVRKRADWMRPSDDPILEHLATYGNLTPKAFENLDVCTSGHATNRLGVLRSAGLVEQFAGTEGLYRLTEDGEAYLNEELDASTLQPE